METGLCYIETYKLLKSVNYLRHLMIYRFLVELVSRKQIRIPLELKPLVYVKSMHCNERIEKLYYSAKFEDICIYCAAIVPPWSDVNHIIHSVMTA